IVVVADECILQEQAGHAVVKESSLPGDESAGAGTEYGHYPRFRFPEQTVDHDLYVVDTDHAGTEFISFTATIGPQVDAPTLYLPAVHLPEHVEVVDLIFAEVVQDEQGGSVCLRRRYIPSPQQHAVGGTY